MNSFWGYKKLYNVDVFIYTGIYLLFFFILPISSFYLFLHEDCLWHWILNILHRMVFFFKHIYCYLLQAIWLSWRFCLIWANNNLCSPEIDWTYKKKFFLIILHAKNSALLSNLVAWIFKYSSPHTRWFFSFNYFYSKNFY